MFLKSYQYLLVRQRLILSLSIVFFLAGIAQQVIAESDLSINQGQVVVAEQSQQVLEQALPKAMKSVLVKMSGSSDVLQAPEIAEQLVKASNYVSNYRYLTDNDQTQLIVTFNQAALARLLQETGQTQWVGKRPTTLFWIQVEGPKGDGVVSSTDTSMFHEELLKLSGARGLPILLPLMDLQDPVSDDLSIPENKLDLVEQLKQRYGVSSVVVARIHEDANSESDESSWDSKWTFSVKGQNLTWDVQAHSEQDLITSALNRITDVVVGDALLSGEQSQQALTLAVTQVSDLVDYAQVMDYLKSLSMVKAVNVQDMQGSTLFVALTIQGGEHQLENKLSTDHRLVQDLSSQSIAQGSSSLLHYIWENSVKEPEKNFDSDNPRFSQSVVSSNSLDDVTQEHAITQGLGQDSLTFQSKVMS